MRTNDANAQVVRALALCCLEAAHTCYKPVIVFAGITFSAAARAQEMSGPAAGLLFAIFCLLPKLQYIPLAIAVFVVLAFATRRSKHGSPDSDVRPTSEELKPPTAGKPEASSRTTYSECAEKSEVDEAGTGENT